MWSGWGQGATTWSVMAVRSFLIRSVILYFKRDTLNVELDLDSQSVGRWKILQAL